MTPSDLCRRALKKAGVLGVGQPLAAEDLNDAFDDLNDMLGAWSRRRYLVYHLRDFALPRTGASTFSVGPGGDLDMVRPDRILSAYVRLLNGSPNPVDVPVEVVGSYEDWAATTLKTLQAGYPQAVFLDSDYPLGAVHVWPSGAAGLYEVHLVFKADLARFAKLSDQVEVPPEYMDALVYNLAQRLRISYQEPPDAELNGLARAALATLRAANVQVPSLKLAAGLPGTGAVYNVYSDTGR